MEYYITPSASLFYPTPIDQAIWYIDSSKSAKLKKYSLGRIYDLQAQLDIPIFFVTDEDLGKVLHKNTLTNISKRYLADDCHGNKASTLPDTIRIPDKKFFNYKETRTESLLKGITDEAALQNPNYGFMYLDEEVVTSSDWLGLYCGFHTVYRCIFIRIDEIMREPLLCNAIGLASVLFHELGHAIMDFPSHASSAFQLKFRGGFNPLVTSLIKYVLEEALANLIAFKCISGPSPYEHNALEFMRLKQPFPYSLGAKLGSATSITAIGLIREIQKYIEGWCRAKDGKIIEDVPEWIKLIYSKPSFTEADLKTQRQTLFLPRKTVTNSKKRLRHSQSVLCDSEKEINAPNNGIKVSQIEINGFNLKNLRPQSEDPYWRDGEMISGVYKPFKYGYINRSEQFVIAPRFDEAEEFSNDLIPGCGPLARVKENGKWGIIKPDGDYLIKPIFDEIRDFSEGFAAVKIDHTYYADWGFIKPDGSYLVEPLFEKVEDFKNGYAEVKTADNARLFTLHGGKCILKSFDDICDTITDETENIVGKRYGAKKGFVDSNGFWYDKQPSKH